MTQIKLTVIASGLVCVEWIEFSLYMYLGVLLSKIFFPDSTGYKGLLLTYMIFALSYLSRPLGGFVFGLFSDHAGRKKPLIFSSLLMGLATIAIGCLPGYRMIGYLSPILLLLLRLVQSFSVSGEFNNSSIFLIEHYPHSRILSGSWIGMAASGGMFLGGFITYLVSGSHYEDSWRVAYIVIGFLSLLLVTLSFSLMSRR